MSDTAWVTLATNDTYSLGALVLANSLRAVGSKHHLAVLITPGVTNPMRANLSSVFNTVQEVNILDSKDEANLRLLKRPELGITFTKLHCWKLTQFKKCVFLDADTLVLQNCDELFDREEFSAAPDVGWPDCFNSGVFVYCPSNDTYEKLIKFALEKGSFDGGDQGLLNLYFSDWSHKDISKHLPFIYNMCSTAAYSYLPAFMQFGINAKIVHFIGNTKPWQQHFDLKNKRVMPSSELHHLTDVLQKWWNIFCSFIHPQLSKDMAENKILPTAQYCPTHPGSNTEVQFTDNRNFDVDIQYREFVDPWEQYDETNTNDSYTNNSNIQCTEARFEDLHDIVQPSSNVSHPNDFSQTKTNNYDHETLLSDYNQSHNDSQVYDSTITIVQSSNSINEFNVEKTESPVTPSSTNILPPEASNTTQFIKDDQKSIQIINESITDSQTNKERLTDNAQSFYCTSSSTKTDWKVEQTDLTLTKGTDSISTNSTSTNLDAGLAGLFAQCTLGADGQTALQDHIHRQSWEVGNIDYLGRDSFDNIWNKICQTLGEDPTKKETPATEEVKVEEAKPEPAKETSIEQPKIEDSIQVTQETVLTAEPTATPEVPKSPEPISAPAPITETVPAPLAVIPPTEASPAVTEAAPAVGEIAPVATAAVPVLTEAVPAVIESAPAVTEAVSKDAPAVIDTAPQIAPVAAEPSKVETATEPTKVADAVISPIQSLQSETVKEPASKEKPTEEVKSTEGDVKPQDVAKAPEVPLPVAQQTSEPTEQKEKIQTPADATQPQQEVLPEQPKEVAPATEMTKPVDAGKVESTIKAEETKVPSESKASPPDAPTVQPVATETVAKPLESAIAVAAAVTETVKQDIKATDETKKATDEPKKPADEPKRVETPKEAEVISKPADTTRKQVEGTEKKSECKKVEAECKKTEGECKKPDCQKSGGECKKPECQKPEAETKKPEEESKVKVEEKAKGSEGSSKKGEGSKGESKKETKDGQTPTPPPRKSGSEGKKKSKK